MSGQLKQGTIVFKNAGQVVPSEYLSLAIKHNPSCFGFAILDQVGPNDNGIPPEEKQLFCEKQDDAIDLDTVNQLQEQSKDCDAVFFFGNYGPKDGTWSEDDVQPFIYEADGKTILASFIEGDFSGYDKDPAKSEQRVLWETYVVPMLTKAFKHSNSVDDFVEDIADETSEKQLLSSAGHRGVFTFLASNGGSFAFADNDLGAEYPWGAVSQTHGYDPDKKPVEEKKTVLSRFSLKKASSEPAVVEPKVEPKKDEPKKDIEPPKVEVKNLKTTVAVVSLPEKEITVPPGLHGKSRKKWFRNTLGLKSNDPLPIGWEGLKSVKVKQTTANLADVQASTKSDKPEDKPVVKEVPASKPSPMELPENVRHSINEFVLKHLDNHSNVIPSPAEIQAIETRYKSFSEQIGVTFEDMLRWPTQALIGMSLKFPQAAVLMFAEMRRNYLTAIGPKAITVDDTGKTNEPQKVETPVQPEEVAPPPVEKNEAPRRLRLAGRR